MFFTFVPDIKVQENQTVTMYCPGFQPKANTTESSIKWFKDKTLVAIFQNSSGRPFIGINKLYVEEIILAWRKVSILEANVWLSGNILDYHLLVLGLIPILGQAGSFILHLIMLITWQLCPRSLAVKCAETRILKDQFNRLVYCEE